MSDLKTKITFRSLNDEQCLAVYEPVRQNARKHYAAAELLAKHDDYANGIAHLILGTEELIKSVMLFLQGYGFPVRDIKNYDQIFYKHTVRHNLLKECYSIYVFAQHMIKKRPAQDPKQTKGQQFANLIMHGLRSAKEGLDNYVWWDNADQLKMNCFYSDYTADGFNEPDKIGMEQWETAHQLIANFALDLNEVMGMIANAQPKQLAEYRRDFNDAELNEVFSGSINRKKKSQAAK